MEGASDHVWEDVDSQSSEKLLPEQIKGILLLGNSFISLLSGVKHYSGALIEGSE